MSASPGRTSRITVGAALCAALFLCAGSADAYPDRPVTMVHPYAPGAASDAFGRAMSDSFARALRQPVLYTNREGASGVVGMRSVATSRPDGYTIALTPMTAIVVQPHTLRGANTEPDRFEGVCGTNENVLTVAVRADSPVQNLQGLIAEGRRRSLTFGSAGPNSLPQLGVVRIQQATGVDFLHVPYRGEAPSLTELLGGRIDFAATTVTAASEMVDAGRMRLITVFSERRHPNYPDVPTSREQGVDALQLSQVGIYAPRGTPAPLIERLEAICREAMEQEVVRTVMAQTRVVPRFMSGADLMRLAREEHATFGRILRELGVQPE